MCTSILPGKDVLNNVVGETVLSTVVTLTFQANSLCEGYHYYTNYLHNGYFFCTLWDLADNCSL